VLSLTVFCASDAAADPIVLVSGVIGTNQGSSGAPGDVDPTATGVFYVAMPVGPDVPLSERLFNVPLTPADVGRTFRATAQSDPGFAGVAARLTNDVNDFVSHALTFPDGMFITSFLLESSLFLQPAGGPPDLTGSTITALTFQLTHLNVNADTESRNLRYLGILSVEGVPAPVIPEPSTVLLMGIGAAAIVRRVRGNSSIRPR
jgi:hypothetical protein